MVALVAADVTLTKQVNSHFISHKVRTISWKIAFGDGALTYPAGGVPLPTRVSFGMIRYLSELIITDDDSAQGIVWKYDRTNHKLRGWVEGITVAAAGAATVDDFPLDTTAETLATAVSLSLTNNTGAGVKYLGRMVEIATGAAPAAAALYALARGW